MCVTNHLNIKTTYSDKVYSRPLSLRLMSLILSFWSFSNNVGIPTSLSAKKGFRKTNGIRIDTICEGLISIKFYELTLNIVSPTNKESLSKFILSSKMLSFLYPETKSTCTMG